MKINISGMQTRHMLFALIYVDTLSVCSRLAASIPYISVLRAICKALFSPTKDELLQFMFYCQGHFHTPSFVSIIHVLCKTLCSFYMLPSDYIRVKYMFFH